jgi:tRNA pseudouridine-54 N-methylase
MALRCSWTALLVTPNFESSNLVTSAITDMISLVPIANRSSFTDVGVTQIANLLGTNTFRVNILHLSGKNIGNCGIRALGRSLEQNQVLKSLTLCLENVGSDGMKALFQALQRNKSLEYLCAFKVLGDVVLGEDAAQALAAALTVNKSLKSLSLDGFCLKKEGVLSLAAAMETNHSLYGLKFDAESGEEAKAELRTVHRAKHGACVWVISSHAPVQGCPNAGLEHSIESAPSGCVRSGTCLPT